MERIKLLVSVFSTNAFLQGRCLFTQTFGISADCHWQHHRFTERQYDYQHCHFTDTLHIMYSSVLALRWGTAMLNLQQLSLTQTIRFYRNTKDRHMGDQSRHMSCKSSSLAYLPLTQPDWDACRRRYASNHDNWQSHLIHILTVQTISHSARQVGLINRINYAVTLLGPDLLTRLCTCMVV